MARLNLVKRDAPLATGGRKVLRTARRSFVEDVEQTALHGRKAKPIQRG